MSDEHTVALRVNSVDVVLFRRRVAAHSLDDRLAALALYRGDLLEQIDDHWVLGQRAMLRELMLATLVQVCQQLVEQRRLTEALLYTHRWVEADPFNETAHRALMRIYMELDRNDTALRHYEQLCELLDRELQATPLPETRAVGEILKAPHEPARPSDEQKLQRRLRELADEELRKLELLALLGNSWSVTLLKQVLAVEPDVALGPLVQQGLIVVRSGAFAFAQVELRELVLAELVSERMRRPLQQIVAALQRLMQQAPPPLQIRLPIRRGSHGRAGRGVMVTWTVDAGYEDGQVLASRGKVALRRHRILRLLAEAKAQGAVPAAQDLAKALGVSVRSVEADLSALRNAGVLGAGSGEADSEANAEE